MYIITRVINEKKYYMANEIGQPFPVCINRISKATQFKTREQAEKMARGNDVIEELKEDEQC